MRPGVRVALVGAAVACLAAMRLPGGLLTGGAALACGVVGVAAVAFGARFPRVHWLATPSLVALTVIPASRTGALGALPWQVGAACGAFAVLVALRPVPTAPPLDPDRAGLLRPWAWAATVGALAVPLAAGLLLGVLPGHLGSIVELRAGGAALLVAAAVLATCSAAALVLAAMRPNEDASAIVPTEGDEA